MTARSAAGILYAWKGVRLGTHSLNTAALLLGLLGDELRAAALRAGVEPGEFRVAAAAAALLHDAGKAARKFQEGCRRGHPRFPYHEVASAWITLMLLRDWWQGGLSDAAVAAAVVAVLRHHHAMRSAENCNALGQSLRGLADLDWEGLAAEYESISQYTRLASRIAEGVRWLAEREKRLPRRRTIREMCYEVVRFLRRWDASNGMSGMSGGGAAATMLTGALALADYVAASLLDGRSEGGGYPRGYAAAALRELGWRLRRGGLGLEEAVREAFRRGLELLRSLNAYG